MSTETELYLSNLLDYYAQGKDDADGTFRGDAGTVRALHAYQDSKHIESDMLVCFDLPQSVEIMAFLSVLRTAGVEAFAVVGDSGSLLDRLAEFQNFGCSVESTCTVHYTDTVTKKPNIMNGIRVQLVEY